MQLQIFQKANSNNNLESVCMGILSYLAFNEVTSSNQTEAMFYSTDVL